LAHASAGPLLDILVPYSSSPSVEPGPTGFLASAPSKEELPLAYAKELDRIFKMSEEEQRRVRERARENARERFGTKVFEEGWEKGWRELMRSQ
jgi:alpha-1,2-mannosyltransferase